MSMVSVWVMKLLEKFEAVARQRRLADNTIDAYRSWIQQFLRFSASVRRQWTRPEELGTADVEAFLNDLVSRRRLSVGTVTFPMAASREPPAIFLPILAAA